MPHVYFQSLSQNESWENARTISKHAGSTIVLYPISDIPNGTANGNKNKLRTILLLLQIYFYGNAQIHSTVYVRRTDKTSREEYRDERTRRVSSF